MQDLELIQATVVVMLIVEPNKTSFLKGFWAMIHASDRQCDKNHAYKWKCLPNSWFRTLITRVSSMTQSLDAGFLVLSVCLMLLYVLPRDPANAKR